MSKTLIIIPGWGGTKKSWADFVSLAQTKYSRVEVIELPCFGEVPCPTSVWGVDKYAAYAKSEIKNLKSKMTDSEIVLLGHSFGGVVAADITANSTELIDQLILSGSPLYRPKYYPKRVIIGIITKVLKLVLFPLPSKLRNKIRRVLYRFIGSPDYAKTAGIKQDIFKKVIREDTSHNIANISTPTLVVWGSRDNYVPLKFGKRIADELPNGALMIIEKGTHGLHIQRKEELLNII